MSLFTKEQVWEDTATPTDNIFAHPNLLCMFGRVRDNKPAYLLTQDQKQLVRGDAKKWRGQYREGKLILEPENQKSHKCLHPLCEGKVFYGLCLQMLDEDGEVGMTTDPFALMNFGWMCNGMTYFFKSKGNRDAVMEWIKKNPNYGFCVRNTIHTTYLYLITLCFTHRFASLTHTPSSSR